ncbi:MAG: aminopeptidase P family protein [Halioglobus sp.]
MTDIEPNLTAVRQRLAAANCDALIVPREDEYLGEYLPAHNERLKWISGFNGSAGMAIVLVDRAAIFVDGRYTVQVRQEVSASDFEYHHLIDEPPLEWLLGQLPKGGRVLCDPRLHSFQWYRKAAADLSAAGMHLQTDTHNLVDQCWQGRPVAKVQPALLLDEQFSGESSIEKRERIGRTISERGAAYALIFASDSVSWLLNIRGRDIPCLPIVQSAALLSADGSLLLLVDPGRIPEGFAEHVGAGVSCVPEQDLDAAFSQLSDSKVLFDASLSNAAMALALKQAGASLVPGPDPVLLPKAAKNVIEIEGSRQAHIRDAVAEVHFLAWLDAEVAAGRLHDEAVLADKLLSFRAQGEFFQDSSFDTISAAGANAAMCHYNHLNTTPASLTMNSVYLVDSGAQYCDGTTDITRTIAIGDPGTEVRKMYTLVLKGHIALATARFPAGTTGTQLDALARQFLWQAGYDYDHGTGHGVGSFLSVHEGPQRIAKSSNSVALLPGMIISNEPGYYRDNEFGMRCENLVVVTPAGDGPDGKTMLEFETITLVPFDNRMLQVDLLTAQELGWLNRYHQKVCETLSGKLAGANLAWLQQATQAVTP